ncbi:MAG: hypothetical protein COB59_08380 [Rhodospirillaceae bacterium]|nr:MAG: hypothetical protein COB59_08380 [Rhodospirillaceae bacterium]
MDTVLIEARSDGERRKLKRAKRINMVARLAGKTYKADDWSMGGFLLESYDGALTTGSLITIEGLGRSPKSLLSVNLPARVERLGERCIAIKYLGLDAKAYAFLQKSMSDNGDMRILLNSSAV